MGIAYPSWDVLIVDQSDDPTTEAIVAGFVAELPELHYLRLDTKGTSLARNAGIARTEGSIVGFLDDDCTVPQDWLSRTAEVFARHPRAAHVFGALIPAHGLAEWSAQGWTPARIIDKEFEVWVVNNLRNRIRLPKLLGNGACLFVRRATIPTTGNFDEQLGPGGNFPSSEDGDLTYRAFMAGYSVVGSPAMAVEHFGLREYADGSVSRLLRAYYYGSGAWLMKILRQGDPFAAIWILSEIGRCLTYIRPLGFLPGHGSTGLRQLTAFLAGLRGSFRMAVDRRQGLYVARPS